MLRIAENWQGSTGNGFQFMAGQAAGYAAADAVQALPLVSTIWGALTLPVSLLCCS